MQSRFIDGEPISKPAYQFERWLRSQNYESVTEMYPAAVPAVALIDDYLQEYPERRGVRGIIIHHAEEIGWISDYRDVEDDEDGPNPDGPEHW